MSQKKKGLSSPLPRNRKGLHPKFQRKRRILNPLTDKPDPKSESWLSREPVAAYLWAREQFLKGSHTLDEISEKIGAPVPRVRKWATIQGPNKRPCWEAEKEKIEEKITKEAYKLNKETYHRVLAETVKALEHGVSKLNADEIQIKNVRDIQCLSSVMETLHRMTQLEDGKPTEITARVKLTREQVLSKLRAADPLIFGGVRSVDEDGKPPTIQ